MNATHIYKGKPVEYIERTYESNGHQFCTILMVNATGKTQRQTVQERHLTPVAADTGYACPDCGSESLVEHRWHCPRSA